MLDSAVDTPGDVSADAPAVPDAACVTYPPDAPSAVASPACTSGATTYLDFGTSLTSNIVLAGATLYASIYDTAGAGGPVTDGRVVAIDLTSGMQSMVLSRTGGTYYLSSANGWIFASEWGTDATLWRWRNGEAPVAILKHRAYLGAVTADDTDMFWNEAGSGSVQANVIERQPLCGGAIQTLITGCTNTLGLVTDDLHVYCASFDHDVYAAPKDGSAAATAIAYNTYPWTSLVIVGNVLYGTDGGDQKLYRIPTPGGPATAFASSTAIGRFIGLASSDAEFYATASTEGIYRITRATGAYTQLATDLTEASPVVWNGQLFYMGRSSIMRCAD